MKAVLVKDNQLVIGEVQTPEPKTGFVLVKNKAFGINRAEVYMRKGEFGETNDIIGIEFAGVVEKDPSNTFEHGQKVISFVGGLARTFGGSYAGYVCVPRENLIPIETTLDWNELAAIPESYATAWCILNWGLQAKSGQTILVRGGTSTLGLALIVLAKQMGLTVIATTRSKSKLQLLESYGVDHSVLDNGSIAANVRQIMPRGINNVAELTGNNTLADSLALTSVNGTVCIAGFLGGFSPLEQFMPLMQIPSTVKLTSFGSAFVIGNDDFPFSKIPIQTIITDIEQNRIRNILANTFPFEQVAEAHRLMESNSVNGKIVVTV